MSQTGKRTRALAPLLGLLLCLVLLPLLCGRAQAVGGIVKIKLNGQELTLESGQGIASNSATAVTRSSGGVAYYKDGILTLNGLNAEYISCYSDLTIQVNGTNTLNGWVEASGGHYNCGIYAYGVLTVEGSGTLSVSTPYSGSKEFCGIYCDSSLTLDRAKVTVNAANGSYGIRARKGITVNGGTLNITAKDTGMRCEDGSITIQGGAKVEINKPTGGTLSNGIYIHGTGAGKTLTISGSGTKVTTPAVTGYAVINYSTVTDATAEANIIITSGATLTIGSCGSGLYSEWSGVRIADSTVTVNRAEYCGIVLKNGQSGARGILEITGSSEVSLTGGTHAVNVHSSSLSNENSTVSKIDLSSGGSVTMKKTGTGNTDYAMSGWIELGENTAVSGGTIRNVRLSTNAKARSIEGNELTFRHNQAPLQIQGWDNKTESSIGPDWLNFEVGKEVNLQLSVSKDGFSGYTSNVLWKITGLPTGLSTEENKTYGFIQIKGTPTRENETYNVSITVEAYGKTATDGKQNGTVQPATLTGTLTIGSTSFNINSNMAGSGWSWDRTTRVLTLEKDVFLNANISLVGARKNGQPLPLTIRVQGSNTLAPTSDSAVIYSDYGVNITGDSGSTLTIIMNNPGISHGINCSSNESSGNDITIDKDVTVKFWIKNESGAVTAIHTKNGDVNLRGSVEITRYYTTANYSVTGIEVGPAHCVNIGDGASSKASLTVEYLYAKDTTVIKAGGVTVNTAPDHMAICTDYDETYTETFESIDLIPEGITGGLDVVSGKLELEGMSSPVVSGKGPVTIGSSAEVTIKEYGGSNDGIYLTGEGSNVTIAPGGSLTVDNVINGISTEGKLKVGEQGSAAVTTLKVERADGTAVSANGGVEIYGGSQVDLTTTGTTVVSTYASSGNGNSTVDLTSGGYVKLTGTPDTVADPQVWKGPIKLGSNTTCTGTKNDMGAPEGYHQYNSTGGKMEFKFNDGTPDPTPTGVTVGGTVKSYNPNNAVTIQLMQSGAEKYRTTIAVSTGSGQVTQKFSIGSVLPGNYDLVVTKPGHLTYTVKNVVVGTENIDLTAMTGKAYQTITLLAGNMNTDDAINNSDMLILRSQFGKTGLNITNKYADINGDGYVNNGDLLIFRGSFGKTTAICTVDY